MTKDWGFGHEIVLADLLDARNKNDVAQLQALCAIAAGMITEQQDTIRKLLERRVGRPRTRPVQPAQQAIGAPRKYKQLVVDAFYTMQAELRDAGKPHSNPATVRALLERYDRRKRPLSRKDTEESERFVRRFAKFISAKGARSSEK